MIENDAVVDLQESMASLISDDVLTLSRWTMLSSVLFDHFVLL